MRRPAIHFLFAIGFAAVLTGCRTIFVLSEADLFVRRHPELRTHYSRLCPTDVELLKEQAFLRDAIRREAAEFVRRRAGADDQLRDELARKQRVDERLFEEEMKVIRALAAALNTHGGQLYFFEREQPLPGTRGQFAIEEGYLVISGGAIRASTGIVRGTRNVADESQ